MQETQVWSLGQKDSLKKEMATHSSILAWKIPWTEEPGRLQSIRSHSQTQRSFRIRVWWQAHVAQEMHDILSWSSPQPHSRMNEPNKIMKAIPKCRNIKIKVILRKLKFWIETVCSKGKCYMFWRQIDLGLYPDGTENFMQGSVPLPWKYKGSFSLCPLPLVCRKAEIP